MIFALTVPDGIEDGEEVRVLEWHGEPGRAFAAGELVVELETHKALVEVRAARPGVLRAVRAAAGDWRPAGGLLAVLSDGPDEPLPADEGALEAVAFDFRVD